jgi:hypothetical protein
MANAIYPKYKEAIVQSAANSSLTGTVKVALVDTGTYTYSAAHEFLSSLTGRVGTDQTIGSKTYTNGVFDGADVTWTAVSGNSVEALVIYIDTGARQVLVALVAYIDTGVTGLPVTPNGGDISATWNASGIFAL